MAGRKIDAFEEQTVFSGPPVSAPDEEAWVMSLVFFAGVEARTVVRLTESRYTLGRSPKADITMDNSQLSRKHAVLKREHGSFSITDLDSTHGIFLNGTQVHSAQLYHGDVLQLGDLAFRFCEWGS